LFAKKRSSSPNPEAPMSSLLTMPSRISPRIDEQQSRIVASLFWRPYHRRNQVLGISPATVKRDWSVAKAWLSRQMKRG
jgi:hypothetical protein